MLCPLPPVRAGILPLVFSAQLRELLPLGTITPLLSGYLLRLLSSGSALSASSLVTRARESFFFLSLSLSLSSPLHLHLA